MLNYQVPPRVTFHPGGNNPPSVFKNSQYPNVLSSSYSPTTSTFQPNLGFPENRPSSEGQPLSLGPRMSSNVEFQRGGAPLYNEAVREQLRIELMKGNPHLTFDGSNPEDFWGWYEELTDKFSAAGYDPYPREIIRALRVHTDKRPKALVTAYINAGLENPADVLQEIWSEFKKRYGYAPKLR